MRESPWAQTETSLEHRPANNLARNVKMPPWLGRHFNVAIQRFSMKG
jgi:hypothetical protein